MVALFNIDQMFINFSAFTQLCLPHPKPLVPNQIFSTRINQAIVINGRNNTVSQVLRGMIEITVVRDGSRGTRLGGGGRSKFDQLESVNVSFDRLELVTVQF